ncbi:MAG: MerR family transcriptional regulator [Anaerolineae bacterium]|nr:MerR family transcriptional regulator [Anaerolineae bacterium]
MTYTTPMFNLKAVVEETGITAHTLRAWERRYGLPRPARSEAGHRLYSQRDIDVLKWLIARQQEGLSIGRAAELWQALEAEGREPLQAMPLLPPAAMPAGGKLAELRQAWVSACLAFDEARAEQVVTGAFALYGPEMACLEVLQRGLAQIGEAWYAGQASVQQEHFATALAMRRLDGSVLATPPPTRAGRILVACPPEEEHAFSLLLAAFLLRRRGWDVLYLGANVPIARLETAIAARRPQLVLSAAQQLPTAATLLEMARFLYGEQIPLAFGGWIFNRLPALPARIPGHFLGQTIPQGVQAAEQLMLAPRPLPQAGGQEVAFEHESSQERRRALAHYRERQPRIEAELWQNLATMGMAEKDLTMANDALARHISAALILCEMSFLDTCLDWAQGLLHNHGLPLDVLSNYLRAYHRAAQAHLDERATPIVNWLATQLSQEK